MNYHPVTTITLRNKPFTLALRPFEAETDSPLVKKWLYEPQVVKWWGHPDKTIQELSEPPHDGGEFIIEVNDKPVGYIRWRVPEARELRQAGLSELPEDVIDIDIAIGDSDYIGWGIGKNALKLLVHKLRSDRPDQRIMICSNTENLRARNSFEKAGFRHVRLFDDPEFGKMWLLLWEPGA